MSTRGLLSFQLQIELTSGGAAVRGGQIYEGAGNSPNALEDLACGFEDEGFEEMLEEGTIDGEGDE